MSGGSEETMEQEGRSARSSEQSSVVEIKFRS
jgi:hypothetical protein